MRRALSIIPLLLLIRSVAFAEDTVDFEKQVAPILETHCIRCHSDNNSKGEFSLTGPTDIRDNEYVVAGDPDASHLYDLVAGVDGSEPEMPKEGEPLSSEERSLVRRWIIAGAEWPEGVSLRERSKADAGWWSLTPIRDFSDSTPPANIDRFIEQKLQDEGLSLNTLADRRTLIRRATYDLTGLPPSPQEVKEFVEDDSPDAYERLIDRLLASHHYGQRWGRHWLDVVRFGESNGFERNVIIDDLWPFRDYVIRSINEDRPFDQMIREHIAGDVLATQLKESDERRAAMIASAFLVAGPYDNVGNQDAAQVAQIRANTIDEIIRASGEAFLGLTIGCARCHDHKFDPILQSDYYAWYATFAGVRHGNRDISTEAERKSRQAKVKPSEDRRDRLTGERDQLNAAVLERGKQRLAQYQARWTRPAIDRQRTEESFEPVIARLVRLSSEGQDANPKNRMSFGIDEFEAWSVDGTNIALASNGGRASGPSRTIEDFPGAYGPQKAIDGKTGERFLAKGGHLTVEFDRPYEIDRVVFSSAKGEVNPEHSKFAFVGEYRIEVSSDGEDWTEVANSKDRKPVNDAWADHRIREQELTPQDRDQLRRLGKEINQANAEIAKLPPSQKVWVGTRESADGPFHVFLGGSPQRKGDEVTPASLSVLDGESNSQESFPYRLDAKTPEADRRMALADWIVHPENPLTARVLANRIWHYHFGTGIVDTPSDFGYMGSQPTHPELLDFLATMLLREGWRIKPLHKSIMMSKTYRQSSQHHAEAAAVDRDARLLWRFPPRRMSAEEIRDSMLSVAGKLQGKTQDSGPGFRLYRYLQDNVATYVPLDKHGPETYRRGVFHQNARASVTDLMTEFDQPDCAFSSPKRAATTTPLQALTMLNHAFTFDMAEATSQRLKEEAGAKTEKQVRLLYRLCYGRPPSESENKQCAEFADEYGLQALCRVVFNTSELIYVR